MKRRKFSRRFSSTIQLATTRRIVSYYQKKVMSSLTDFTAMLAIAGGAAGDFVKIAAVKSRWRACILENRRAAMSAVARSAPEFHPKHHFMTMKQTIDDQF
jgi:hypothetical protein